MEDLLEIAGGVVAELLGHPLVGAVLGAAAIVAVVLWLASAWWTWRDLAARTHDPVAPYVASAGVLVATPALFPLALLVYWIVRPPAIAAEEDVAALRAAALASPRAVERCWGCGSETRPGWRRCPSCGAELTVACEACHRPIGRDWAICPWCAAEPPSTSGPPSTATPA